MEKTDGTERESVAEIRKLVKKVRQMGGGGRSTKLREEVKDEIVSLGGGAVPPLIGLLDEGEDSRIRSLAAEALGEIGDGRAIPPLSDALKDEQVGRAAMEALLQFGPACVPEVTEKVEHEVANPVEEDREGLERTYYPLLTIGRIRCDESVEFLNELLDDYMSEIPDEPFEPGEEDWKYAEVNFYHILDAMVAQQDERAIPHIEGAEEFFPERSVEPRICREAIDRIEEGDPDSAFAWEAVEMAFPAEKIMEGLGWIGSEWGRERGESGGADESEELIRCPGCGLDLPAIAETCPDCGRGL
ncbi:hypothetical protein AKJ38_04210 [candidate division MSBL1 archaeon SCGC-AAA259I14]|uniref:Zinc-ribbon domain-containing protein n=1 Tax=candidate division MSBL1 archaeon SCGC-AAA259I14 TaxID=1698268 RepID=A0A133UNY6_9EURY|nr:hypothetical protein AKJ38_04210 [candidate division MSBL1 archaeon SCGC-AAA259I14]